MNHELLEGWTMRQNSELRVGKMLNKKDVKYWTIKSPLSQQGLILPGPMFKLESDTHNKPLN